MESTLQDVIYEVTETIGDTLELYATVQEKGTFNFYITSKVCSVITYREIYIFPKIFSFYRKKV